MTVKKSYRDGYRRGGSSRRSWILVLRPLRQVGDIDGAGWPIDGGVGTMRLTGILGAGQSQPRFYIRTTDSRHGGHMLGDLSPTLSDRIPAVAGGTPVRSRERFLTFGAPVIGEPEVAGVLECLRRRWIGTGPKVEEFEQEFACFKGAQYAVAVNSGTAALHLALLALGIGPGDEVITTAMTFCSTVHAIVHTGATPVLVDCDRNTFNIDPSLVSSRVNSRTRAILVVHMCGRCCDMAPILAVAREHGLRVVEDCAHAVEASWGGVPSGLLGDVGCFSFYATKNLTTCEGGMVLTRDPALAAEVRVLAYNGMSADAWRRFSDRGYQHYAVVRAGFKNNMPDLHAAIGLAQLRRLQEQACRREEIWQRYQEQFRGLACVLPPPQEAGTRHARHLYTPLLSLEELTASRDEVLDALTAENIGVGVHFIPVHRHLCYQNRWREGQFPNAEFIGARTLSLPLAGDLTDEDAEDVCRGFRRILLYFRRE